MIPKIPVPGLGKIHRPNKASTGYDIDNSSERSLGIGGRSFPTLTKKIGGTNFSEVLDSKRNKKIPQQYSYGKKFGSYMDYLRDATTNKPKIDNYVVHINVPKFRNHEKKFHSEKHVESYQLDALNKLIAVYHAIAIEELYDYQRHNMNDLAKEFKERYQPELARLSEVYSNSGEEKKKAIGLYFLKFIIDEGYVDEYIMYLEYGLAGYNTKKEKIEGFPYDTRKAMLFEEAVTINIFLSTMNGFKYSVKPWGVIDAERNVNITKQWGFQELDVRYFGHNRQAVVLTVHQKYLDEISLYHGQIDYGPVMTFMDKTPKMYDFMERKHLFRVKCFLIQGTTLLSEYTGKNENLYESLKMAYEYKKDIKKTYNKVVDKMNQYENPPGTYPFRSYNIQKISSNDVKKDIEDIYKILNGWIFWYILYRYIIASNKKLENNKKKWIEVTTIQGQLPGKWDTSIVFNRRKTIYRIIDPQSSKMGTSKEWLRLTGLNMDDLPHLKYYNINCNEIQKGISKQKKNRVIIV